jgi:16S rRNA (cytidine1402-2'-O)-methyltransferase
VSPPSGPTGRLVLVPNTLDTGLGADHALTPLDEVLPLGVIRTAAGIGHWICESSKTTRAFLKRIDAIVPLAAPLQSLQMRELPRPQKGGAARGGIAPEAWRELLAPALAGHDIGLSSEAGLPAVADPGAALVQQAHAMGIAVVALPGPSSLLLALAASGLQGQHFAFVGYLPVEAAARSARIRELESVSRRLQQSQLMIETPYRNGALLTALLADLQGGTRLAVSCGLTLSGGFNRSDTVASWRRQALSLPADVPAVFSLLA